MVDIEGKLLRVEIFGVVLIDEGGKQVFEIGITGQMTDGRINGGHLPVGQPFEPAEPDLDVAFLAQ